MITALVVKVLWGLGGVLVGWAGKHWHIKPLIDAAKELEETPKPPKV